MCVGLVVRTHTHTFKGSNYDDRTKRCTHTQNQLVRRCAHKLRVVVSLGDRIHLASQHFSLSRISIARQ